MNSLTLAFVFVFGAVIGSFLNAVIWRLHADESIVHGRSHCTSCGHLLGFSDLIPLVSYMLLRGRCRYCSARIHPHYILVEAATAALFTLFALHDGVAAGSLARLLVDWYSAAALVVIFVYDALFSLIPRRITLPATVIVLAANLLLGAQPWRLFVGVAVGAGFFALQYLVSRGTWIGWGDVHLGALIGALCGWPQTGLVLFMAYVGGAVIASAMLLSGRAKWKSELPFGTFLTAATAVSLLWGQEILNWYLHLL